MHAPVRVEVHFLDQVWSVENATRKQRRAA